jgi:maleate isomerase
MAGTAMDQAANRSKLYGHRARIGYTSPPLTAEVFPYEFYKIVPAGVTLVISTLAVTELSPAELDQSQAISMQAARAMVAAGVDIVVFGGVPINLRSGGDDGAAMIARLEAELGVKVSTSAWCQEKATRTLGCRKVIVVHPYDASQHARQSSYAVKFGCEVVAVGGVGATLPMFGTVPRDATLELGRALIRQHPEADSIFFPAPHSPATEAIEPLEREFGVTVMTAGQAAIWDALRRVGVNDKIEGYGRLFREF